MGPDRWLKGGDLTRCKGKNWSKGRKIHPRIVFDKAKSCEQLLDLKTVELVVEE